MAKYSQKVYEAVANGDLTKPGVKLGTACIDAQIPVQVVAKWMGLSRQGIYYWFMGVTDVAGRHRAKADQITQVLLAGLDDNKLPAVDLPTALEVIKQYRRALK